MLVDIGEDWGRTHIRYRRRRSYPRTIRNDDLISGAEPQGALGAASAGYAMRDNNKMSGRSSVVMTNSSVDGVGIIRYGRMRLNRSLVFK